MWHQERHSPGDTMRKMIRKGLLSIWIGLQEGVSVREKLEGGAAGSREEAGGGCPLQEKQQVQRPWGGKLSECLRMHGVQ